jgi:hypothetical protein
VSQTALAPLTKLDVTAVQPAPTTGVVPFERLVVPSTLSGATGRNRAVVEDCSIKVSDDYGAIKAWLSMYAPGIDPVTREQVGNANTWRAYRKEAERLAVVNLRTPQGTERPRSSGYRRLPSLPGDSRAAFRGLQERAALERALEAIRGPAQAALAHRRRDHLQDHVLLAR